MRMCQNLSQPATAKRASKPSFAIFLKSWTLSSIAEGEDRNTDVFVPALSTLTSLTYLNKLTELPSSIGALTKLQKLYVKVTEAGRAFCLQEMYKHTHEQQHAHHRSSQFNLLTSLPESFPGISELTDLFINFNELTELPSSIGALTKLQELYVKGTEVGRALCLQETYKHTHEYMHAHNSDLMQNQLTSLPGSISELSELTSLDTGSNQLTSLPESISGLSELIHL
ncbi:Leucine-rich repeat-containing protein 1 [Hondaea fermentalgiana]|uniref:Leucine-rich repeat-containing protein 1 n=1 Tax=Hondaea fermentalgiana TaxID=2315210 RepID=A0A2R5GWK9_9STRA|nr:Leucine-rich repeat-containing protein 1 [Hondaea fermentalgiana]|eukprot:GBG34965.1 Leucine-rich repeat-containing protein 1 [Hondaea fermentalgiana]